MSWTVEIESSVSAVRMFNGAILDWHNLGPQIMPEVLESGTEEGNIRQLNFTSVMPFSYVKERMDFVNHQMFECETTITEGGHLGTKLQSASLNYKIVEASSGDGCDIKLVVTTKPLPGIELDDEAAGFIEKSKEAIVKHFKIVEAYLLTNPDKYYVPSPPPNKLIQVSSEVDDVALAEIDDGEGHPRDFYGRQPFMVNGFAGQYGGGFGNFGGIQSNGIVNGIATQIGGGGYGGNFGGIQSNGMVNGNAMQFGGGYGSNWQQRWGCNPFSPFP